jgi:hypothetical protein
MKMTTEGDNLRYTKIPLTNGSGVIPALGFGTLIPDPIDTKRAITVALEAGFRQFDSAERYRNEKEVREAMQEVFKERKIKREDVFIATKLGCAHETENKVRLGLPRIIQRKENAPEFDYSSFYAKTGAGDPLLCGGGLASLMTCPRTAAHEETELLTVLKIPFRVRTPTSR